MQLLSVEIDPCMVRATEFTGDVRVSVEPTSDRGEPTGDGGDVRVRVDPRETPSYPQFFRGG